MIGKMSQSDKMSQDDSETEMKMTSQPSSEWDEDEMDCMLNNFIEMKKVENDPQQLADLKKYAEAKGKMVEELFGVQKTNKPSPKSFDDLKKLRNKKLMEEDD